MRVALLVLTLTMASLAGSMRAGAEFNCFQTPGEGIRCACIGASGCSEMKNSGSCRSEPECDNGELGAIVCSCKAARTPKAERPRPTRRPLSLSSAGRYEPHALWVSALHDLDHRNLI
jgi:hypothetical protein